ncbi:50S ribosomal protein L11 methyltransferase [Cytophaga sp. FL35]|uniref:50S ribosomal protein L11 methyltransferase n=1 Tax=Cytophaga sp. FL35 TaxID=1904456 RepID=UPI00165361A2|nr:50S ribosomal protein L11 methyltransferase [Cytophaga sp. FL35]MBC6998211.1 50S ribosomal protein L11 methyltransferase [Cytophaga sp. FL35]
MENTIYIEYSFTVLPLQPATDILIAELGEVGFESFVENETGVLAYIQKEEFVEGMIDSIEILRNTDFTISFEKKEIEQENWNATWEENFSPILVGEHCSVRAPFHKKPQVTYDIVIEPKMSFGTGHHETTHMMLQMILDHDFEGKSVLDMGSGTGVLAILAAMKGATNVEAIDIDNWCYHNAMENVERNNVQVSVFEGDVTLLKGVKLYDVVLANINRNILINDIPAYAKCLKPNGILFVSGFYEDDIFAISEICNSCGLKFEKNITRNNWVAVKYVF